MKHWIYACLVLLVVSVSLTIRCRIPSDPKLVQWPMAMTADDHLEGVHYMLCSASECSPSGVVVFFAGGGEK